MKTTLDPSSPMERHTRKCAICTHPDREAIDQAFLNGSRKPDIVKHYSLPTLSSLYRHAHATGLYTHRRSEAGDSNRENRASTGGLTQTKSQPNSNRESNPFETSNRENRPGIGFMTPEIQRMLIGK